jgi:hypothetical protein
MTAATSASVGVIVEFSIAPVAADPNPASFYCSAFVNEFNKAKNGSTNGLSGGTTTSHIDTTGTVTTTPKNKCGSSYLSTACPDEGN